MRNKLKSALEHSLWVSHSIGDIYGMDGKGEWKISYYPIFECGKKGEVYNEPQAYLIEHLARLINNFLNGEGR